MFERKMTKDEQAILALFEPATYCIDLPPTPARKRLEEDKLIEWVPAPAWSGYRTFAITEVGRAALAANPPAWLPRNGHAQER